MRKKNLQSYGLKETSVILNNAVQACLRPAGKEITEARLRRLRNYAQALVEPLIEHTTGGIDDQGAFGPVITPQELVGILVSAALFVHLSHVTGNDKLPQAKVAELLFGKE